MFLLQGRGFADAGLAQQRQGRKTIELSQGVQAIY